MNDHIPINLYKNGICPFLLNHRNAFVLEKFSQLDQKLENTNNDLSSIQFKQLLFFARICFSQIDSKEEELTCQVPLLYDNLLMDDFLADLAQILYDNINQQNILVTFRIISLLSNNKQIYSHLILLDIIKMIISNLPLLTQKQITQLNFNFLLKIIRHNYKEESTREQIQSIFPIKFLLFHFSDIFNLNFTKYGLQWLKFLNTYSSYQHSVNDGRLIFEEISKLINKIRIIYHFKYICSIIINMIKFQTIPLDIFESHNFQFLFYDLLSNKSNNEIIEYVLYLIGLCTLNNIFSGFYNVDLFINIFSEYRFDENIRILVLWNLSVGLSDGICHFLIESEFLDNIVDIYQTSSFKLKHEISSLITDMMCISADPPDIFLSDQILEILVNSMIIFDDDVFKIGIALCQTIEDYIIQNQDEGERIEMMKQYLIDLNIMEIIANLEENSSDLNILLLRKLKDFLNIDDQKDE